MEIEIPSSNNNKTPLLEIKKNEINTLVKNATKTNEINTLVKNATKTNEINTLVKNATNTNEINILVKNATNTNEPKILFIDFNENQKYFMSNSSVDPKSFMYNLISKINESEPDIIVCAVNNSLSCTDDHMPHHLGRLIDIKYKKDREKNYKDYLSVYKDYKLLSKADTVKKKNSSPLSCASKKILGKKIYGSRIRVFGRVDINSDFISNISGNSSSKKYPNNSNYGELYTEAKYDKCATDTFCVTKIGFKRYSNEINGGILYDITVKKNNNIFRYFFIYSGYIGSVSNELLVTPKSDIAIPSFYGTATLNVPYKVQIFIINNNTFEIKYAEYEKDTPIYFLTFKQKLENFKTLKHKAMANNNLDKLYPNIHYFNSYSMKFVSKAELEKKRQETQSILNSRYL
jgi:hypothetical protein